MEMYKRQAVIIQHTLKIVHDHLDPIRYETKMLHDVLQANFDNLSPDAHKELKRLKYILDTFEVVYCEVISMDCGLENIIQGKDD